MEELNKMAKVEVKEPTMVVIEFRQEKSDKYYGSCLWARFVFDTENYDLHISSDCGEYGYSGWLSTPDRESFLKLLSGMDSEYLLGKISKMSVIDTEKTYKNVKEIIEEEIDFFDDNEYIEKPDMDFIYTACTYDNETDVFNGILSEIAGTAIDKKIDDYELLTCIVKDYPPNAKRIANIFTKYIQPKIKEILKGVQR